MLCTSQSPKTLSEIHFFLLAFSQLFKKRNEVDCSFLEGEYISNFTKKLKRGYNRNMNKSDLIKNFILSNVEKHPKDIAAVLADKFNFSRQRAHHYLSREIKNGNIIKTGHTRRTRYFLSGRNHVEFIEKIEPDLAEDTD